MASEKFSASMDNELLDQVRAAAAKQGLTLSAWLARAADHQVRLEALRELVAEWEGEHGAITGSELDAFELEVAAARAATSEKAPARGDAPARSSRSRTAAPPRPTSARAAS